MHMKFPRIKEIFETERAAGETVRGIIRKYELAPASYYNYTDPDSTTIPDLDTIIKIAEKADVSLDWLIGKSDLRSRYDTACGFTDQEKYVIEYMRKNDLGRLAILDVMRLSEDQLADEIKRYRRFFRGEGPL